MTALSAAQQAILTQLSSSGQLSGLSPTVIEAIAQAEGGDASAGDVNSAGYGGFFGLAPGTTYPGGSVSSSLMAQNSTASFTQQAIVAASAFASYLKQTGGNVDQAEAIYQTGKATGSSTGPGIVNSVLAGASPYSNGAAATGETGSLSSATPTATAAPTANAPAQSVSVDGQTYYTPVGDANASSQTSALSAMAATMASYGFTGTDLQNLVSWAWGEITSNTDPSQVAIDIQTPGSQAYPIFEKQFPGFTAANQQLTSQGLQAVSVGQYQGLQTGYVAAAQAAGLPPGFINSNDVGTLVGNNVSTAEWSARLNDATSLAYQSAPEDLAELNQYFGTSYAQAWGQDPFSTGQAAPTGHGPLTVGQVAALALDPNVAEPLIHQQIQAAQIGGAGVTAGLGSIDVATAQKLAQAGITTSQATNAFQSLAPYSALENARPGMGGEASEGTVSADQLATGQLLGDPGAQRQLQSAVEVAKAPFAGGGGYVQSSKGAVGVGSASSAGAGNS